MTHTGQAPALLPGLLLTGGASRRMGVAKATLVLDGETLADRAARLLSTVCDPVVEVGPGFTELTAVREDPAGTGPLAAIVAGADSLGGRSPLLVLAVDLPFVTAPLLRLLAEWPGTRTVAPWYEGQAQSACARLGSAALDEGRAALATGQRALRWMLQSDCEYVSERQWREVAPAHALVDVDTPEVAARWGIAAV